MLIDLRSDILGRPTQEMIEAMTEAARARCTYGLREDPITTRLEQFAANMLGKEDALFFPTATMCNQVAIHILCSPGQELIAESESHVFTLEGGGSAALSGVMSKPIRGEMGVIDLQEMEEAISPGTEQRSRTGLIWVENTHNRAGGTVISVDQMKAIYNVAKRYGVSVHLDGARIFNAAVYLNVPVSELTQYADTVTVNFNKGLSAPLGAILAGSRDFIKEAGRARLMFGGGWRPTGILAAPGIVALEKMIDRLAVDHKNARRIAEGVANCQGVFVDLKTVQTNIINVKINHPRLSPAEVVERLKQNGVFVNLTDPNKLRLVVHWEIGEKEVDEAIRVFHQILDNEKISVSPS
jgi:threonine aldolase